MSAIVTGYVPEAFSDEISPPPRIHPDSWLAWVSGAWCLHADGMAEVAVPDGTVEPFLRFSDFGVLSVRITEAGVVPDDLPHVPAGATHFHVVAEPDVSGGSLLEVLEELVSWGALDAGEIDVAAYTWTTTHWRVGLAEDGRPHFEPATISTGGA